MPAKSTEDVITSLIEFANKRKITITKEEMLKIAQLVRIKLSNDEIDRSIEAKILFYTRK